jgi:hypothetical protein
MYRGWYTHELKTLDMKKEKKNRKFAKIRFLDSFKDRKEVELRIIEDIAKGLDSTIPKMQPVQILQEVHTHFKGYEKMLSKNARRSVDKEVVLYDFLYGGL